MLRALRMTIALGSSVNFQHDEGAVIGWMLPAGKTVRFHQNSIRETVRR